MYKTTSIRTHLLLSTEMQSDDAAWRDPSPGDRKHLELNAALRKVLNSTIGRLADGGGWCTMPDMKPISPELIRAVTHGRGVWANRLPLQQELYDKLLASGPAPPVVADAKDRILDYVMRETCGWNPWVRVYTTLERVAYQRPEVAVQSLKEATDLARSYRGATGTRYDQTITMWLRIAEVVQAAWAEFSGLMKLDEEFTTPRRAEAWNDAGDAEWAAPTGMRDYIEQCIAGMRVFEKGGLLLDKRKWLVVRCALPLGAMIQADATRAIEDHRRDGTLRAWPMATYNETYEAVLGAINTLGLRSSRRVDEEKQKSLYRPLGRPALGERVESEAFEKKDTASSWIEDPEHPHAVGFTYALHKWCGSSPLKGVDETFLPPPSSQLSLIGQSLRPFINELSDLTMFATEFDRINQTSEPEVSFLRNYVLLESDLVMPYARRRWRDKMFLQTPMDRLHHCPFILICRDGFVVCSYQKRAPPVATAIAAIEQWYHAMAREPCRDTLHVGHKVQRVYTQ